MAAGTARSRLMDQLINDIKGYSYETDVKIQSSRVFEHYSDVKPACSQYAHPGTHVVEALIVLEGTIEVNYKGSNYNIPLRIYLPKGFPSVPPSPLVIPTATMKINPSKFVDSGGRVYLPYLHEWTRGGSDLVTLIQTMVTVFSEKPPVFAKSASPILPVRTTIHQNLEMATKLPSPSVDIASNATTRFVQLRTEIEDEFTDLHQMLDVRRQQLLDKLTEMEEMNNKYFKHTEAIANIKFTIATMQQTFGDDLLADAQQSALPIFQQKLEILEKENLKSVNMETLKLICDKTVFKNRLDSISISDSKIAVTVKELGYSNRTAPILAKVDKGTIKGEINNPTGLCIDDVVNEVYICDDNPAHGSRIHIFSLEGVFIREFVKYHLKCPHSIALSSSDVFVTNSKDSHCLLKFNKDGTFVKKTGSKGSGDGQFNFPLGVCVANELVYVCDEFNNRIQAFAFDLRFSFKFTSSELTAPIGIKFCSNQLFVSKHSGSTIFVYSLEGTYIKYIQLTGDGSPLNKAYYFTMDIAGNYLFSENRSSCIQIFSPSGKYVASLGGDYLQTPRGVAVDKQGLLVCVCLKDGAVFQIY